MTEYSFLYPPAVELAKPEGYVDLSDKLGEKVPASFVGQSPYEAARNKQGGFQVRLNKDGQQRRLVDMRISDPPAGALSDRRTITANIEGMSATIHVDEGHQILLDEPGNRTLLKTFSDVPAAVATNPHQPENPGKLELYAVTSMMQASIAEGKVVEIPGERVFFTRDEHRPNTLKVIDSLKKSNDPSTIVHISDRLFVLGTSTDKDATSPFQWKNCVAMGNENVPYSQGESLPDANGGEAQIVFLKGEQPEQDRFYRASFDPSTGICSIQGIYSGELRKMADDFRKARGL